MNKLRLDLETLEVECLDIAVAGLNCGLETFGMGHASTELGQSCGASPRAGPHAPTGRAGAATKRSATAKTKSHRAVAFAAADPIDLVLSTQLSCDRCAPPVGVRIG